MQSDVNNMISTWSTEWPTIAPATAGKRRFFRQAPPLPSGPALDKCLVRPYHPNPTFQPSERQRPGRELTLHRTSPKRPHGTLGTRTASPTSPASLRPLRTPTAPAPLLSSCSSDTRVPSPRRCRLHVCAPWRLCPARHLGLAGGHELVSIRWLCLPILR